MEFETIILGAASQISSIFVCQKEARCRSFRRILRSMPTKPFGQDLTALSAFASYLASRASSGPFSDPEKTERKRFAIEDDGLELANRLQQRQVASDCARWLSEKVDIRSVLDANFVHGKMYHVDDGRRETRNCREF